MSVGRVEWDRQVELLREGRAKDWWVQRFVCTKCGRVYESEGYREECICGGRLVALWEKSSFWRNVKKRGNRLPVFFLEGLRRKLAERKQDA